MQSNITLVTHPDLYYSTDPSILLIGCDDYMDAILDTIRRMPIPVTVYTASKDSPLDWTTSAYYQSRLTIINCMYDEFLLGFFIDKSDVYYYNKTRSFKNINLNEIADPIDALIKWINTCQDQNHALLQSAAH